MGVLLVDEDRDAQNVVNETLHEAGFTVLFVHDGLSGLDAAILEKPELIIVDSHLPGIGIADFVKRIRRRVYLAKTPILLLIHGEDDYDPSLLEAMGISAVINKPIDPTSLCKEVENQISSVKEESLAVGSPVTEENEGGISVEVGSLKTAHSVEKAIHELKGDENLRNDIRDVVEKISWEAIPGIIEMALPKETLQSIVERVVWETVPPLAEIEIKKEIKRLQTEQESS